MNDTQIIIVVGKSLFTIWLNECNDGSPWVSRNVIKDGVLCDLYELDVALAAEHGHDLFNENKTEAALDRILIPALAATKRH